MSTLAATFADAGSAAQAKASLLQCGIAEERMVLSIALTGDDIAAEAPGQSYENQTGEDSAEARYNSGLRAGGCVLSVRCDSAGEVQRVTLLLREQGARSLARAPGT